MRVCNANPEFGDRPYYCRMKQYLEPLLIGIALIAYGLRPMLGSQLLVVALGSLAVFYNLSAFQALPPAPDNAPSSLFADILLPKITGIGAAVAVIGILFGLMHWNGAAVMLLVGGSTLVMAGFFSLTAYLSSRQPRLLAGVVRAALIGGLALVLFAQLPPQPRPAQRAPTGTSPY